MIVAAIIALGIVSLRGLVIDLLPEIDLPIAVVATSYHDAAPEEVENLISRPIEATLSTVEGIETIQSQSQAGASLVLLMFKNGTDLDQALLDVREKVDQIKGFLPDRAGEPNILRFSPDQLPVIWVSLTGADAATLTQLAEDEVVPYFERQEGVASVTIEGAKEREIQLVLDQTKLQQYGVSTQMLMQALYSANQSSSVGTVQKGSQDLQIRVVGEFESLTDIEQTIVQTPTGATIQIADVADVQDTFKETSTLTLVDGEPSLVLSVMKKTDGNTVDVARQIKDSMEDLKQELGENISLDVVIDTSEFIEMSIDSVIDNILIGGAIAIGILLLFLKSVRATIVIGISIPIAIISTFILMYFTGESLNILTLGGLALGLGMVVDSSIVILENIYSYRQKGHSLFDAAVKGATELTPAVIASTLTTLVVFLPIVFVEGLAADLFAPLALTVTFSLISSLAVAITLVPMLSSKLLTKTINDGEDKYWFNRLLKRLTNGYERALKWVLNHRKTAVTGTIIAIVASLAFIPFIGAELFPAADQGQVQITVTTAPGTSLEYTEKVTDQVNEKLTAYEEYIETNYMSLGGGGFAAFGGTGNQATYTIQLTPSTDRDKTTTEIVQNLSEELQDIPSAEITVSEMDSSMSFGSPIQIELNGPEHTVLRELAEQVVDEIAKVDGVFNPETSASDGIPQMRIEIDDAKAAMYGLNQQQIIGQIDLQFNGQVATRYREAGREMDVTLIYPEEERSTISDLEDLKIQTPTGTMIALEEVAEFREMQGPVALLRQNQQPQINVTSDIVNRDLASIVNDIETRLEQMNLPEGYDYNIGGEAEDMAQSFSELTLALLFAIFLVYAVMAVQFENLLYPFVIMFAMPTAIIGVILGHVVTNISLSIPGFIGLIMLAGIVVNNSIILVDYINILRRRGMDRYEAIIEAGKTRLRPILMTTLTTIFAMIPLGLALGEGAELQQPLAVTIIFGLTVSSIFTLLLIPVIYVLFDNLANKILRRNKKEVTQ